MNYDTMSVNELVTEIAKDATHEVACLMSADMSYENHRAGLESALRKAVIREASVVVRVFGDYVGSDECGSWGTTIRTESDGRVEDGDYYLIPQETS